MNLNHTNMHNFTNSVCYYIQNLLQPAQTNLVNRYIKYVYIQYM